MRAGKMKKKKKNIVLRVAFAAFAVYVVVQVVSLQVQLRTKQQELEMLEAAAHRQELVNEALQEKVENHETYLEEEARNQGYSLPGEQIYKVVPEN